MLDGNPVASINASLTSTIDIGTASRLNENANLSFIGVQVYGPFDIPEETAKQWLALPVNPNGRSNADVLKKYFNASDLVRRWGMRWIVDFGADSSEEEAAQYEAPYEHVREHVRPLRLANREPLRKNLVAPLAATP
ncbi:MAG: hypothetical protein R2843_13625 [Thermomicrobiales bacterium]